MLAGGGAVRPSARWQDDAACRGRDLVLFFGPDGERQPEREIREREAKAVCADCPVTGECLDYALERAEKSGIWGAMNEDERHNEHRSRLRRRRTPREAAEDAEAVA
jgi:WhiB family transcriptional regulator, redox-sensing transcriptional regulator